MDWKKIHKIWKDFTSKYNLELKNVEQNIAFTTKKQTYSTVETHDGFNIYYKYFIYEFNAIDAANLELLFL